jgi:hypothetical protein
MSFYVSSRPIIFYQLCLSIKPNHPLVFGLILLFELQNVTFQLGLATITKLPNALQQ